ncbi:MAG: metal-sulfur cluster assembly factor [Gemmatimonadaceae bacterium]
MSEHEIGAVGSAATDAAEPIEVTGTTEMAGEVQSGIVTEDQVKAALRRVKDPDLNLNIIDLGLVYSIAVEGAKVSVDMSLTSPGCPSGPEIMGGAEEQIRALPGVEDVAINLVWSPFWSPDRIEPRIRSYLGL